VVDLVYLVNVKMVS